MDIKNLIAQGIAPHTGMSPNEVCDILETPPDREMGDYALPCFRFAKTLKKAPPVIAQQIADELEFPPVIDRFEVKGGYLNFFVNTVEFAKSTLKTVVEGMEGYGRSDMGGGKNIVLDYSSINIAKPFHIGHLSTTALGNSLYRIYNFIGYNSIGVNHLGDWGTQFGKLITAYKMWGNKEDIEKRGVRGMLDIYVHYHKQAEINPALDDTARAWFKKIEEGHKDATDLFTWFKKRTLEDVDRVYAMLDVKFDSYAGESFYNDKMDGVIDELKEKNLLEESEGAYVVNLDAYDLPPCLILKSDGATLYATRDLAAAFYRENEYNFEKCLYVVAYQQNLHFKQLFSVIELMGHDWSKKMEHVAFGMVSLEDGTLSTREGRVVYLEEVLQNAIDKSLEIIDGKNPDLENKSEIAEQIGVGAVVFSALCNNRIKDITFNMDRVLNFDGETAPYIQYTHARCKSLLRKSDIDVLSHQKDYSALDNKEAHAVVRALADFPQTVVKAAERNEPCIISRHIIDLAQAINKFYFEHRVLSDDANKSAARLELALAGATVIKTGLYLLGIKAPEKM